MRAMVDSAGCCVRTRIEFAMRGGAVARYHTIPTIRQQNVAEHSFGVAWLCWHLSNGSPSAALLMAALIHDVAEHTTGDLPAPAKRRMGIREQFAEAEDEALLEAGITQPVLSPEEQVVLKLADVADLLLFCITEISMGNRSMCVVYERGVSYIRELIDVMDETAHELFMIIQEMRNECER